MTTETPPIDPVVEAWSDRLEDDLIEAGLTQAQARVYRLAFELGLTRVISQTATRQELNDGLAMGRQELNDGLAMSRQELKDGLADLRDEIRREMGIRFAAVDRRFAAIDQRFDDAAEYVERRFDGVDGRFDDVDDRFDRIERRWWIALGLVVSMQAGIYALLGVLLSR